MELFKKKPNWIHLLGAGGSTSLHQGRRENFMAFYLQSFGQGRDSERLSDHPHTPGTGRYPGEYVLWFYVWEFLERIGGGEFGEVWGSTIPKLNSE